MSAAKFQHLRNPFYKIGIFTLRIICGKAFDIDRVKMMNQLKAEMIVIFYGV